MACLCRDSCRYGWCGPRVRFRVGNLSKKTDTDLARARKAMDFLKAGARDAPFQDAVVLFRIHV